MEAIAPSLGRVRFDLRKSAWLYAMLGVGLAFGTLSPTALACAAALFVLTVGLGHSVGLHRGIIHRTYVCDPWVRRALVLLFAQTGLGGPISWIRLHRVRDDWQNRPDTPPYFAYRHSLARDFGWNLHCRFDPADPERYGFEEPDRFLRFVEATWALHPLALFAILAVVFDLHVAATCVCARVAVTILGHWFVGFVSHKHGYVRWEIPGATEIGRNTLLLGWLSFGEGFHNNHHAFPGSAKMGQAWWEFDAGWWLVRALEALGLVREVRSWEGRARRENVIRVGSS